MNDDRFDLPEALDSAWRAALDRWDREEGTRRLFERDASLWTGGDEDRWLGWLGSPRTEEERLDELLRWQQELDRFDRVLLLGMGGSSLGPEVVARIVGAPRPLRIVDSTDPGAARSARRWAQQGEPLILAASKSGTTLETAILLDLFREAWSDEPWRFVAITDPGSALERRAKTESFGACFLGDPEIGGRFSVLSPFGLVPAAATGLDVRRWLEGSHGMSEACRRERAEHNPGVRLGALLGVAAEQGRDKVTLCASDELAPLGAWLEQLLAESTGKGGRGLLPIDGEPGPPDAWRDDRLVVALGTREEDEIPKVERARSAGTPVVWLTAPDPWYLSGELYRWEIATAVAGWVLGLDPFDQPDVEAAKVATREITDRLEAGESLPPSPSPLARSEELELLPLGGGAAATAGSPLEPPAVLREILAPLEGGGYLGLLAYLEPSPVAEAALREIRRLVAERFGVATSLGYGPRYLHSTGQAHKGGPAGGVFLVIQDRPAEDEPVPGRDLTFGQVRDAQAAGDARVLAERGRGGARVLLSGEAAARLDALVEAVRAALGSA